MTSRDVGLTYSLEVEASGSVATMNKSYMTISGVEVDTKDCTYTRRGTFGVVPDNVVVLEKDIHQHTRSSLDVHTGSLVSVGQVFSVVVTVHSEVGSHRSSNFCKVDCFVSHKTIRAC